MSCQEGSCRAVLRSRVWLWPLRCAAKGKDTLCDISSWSLCWLQGKLQGPCSIASFRLWLSRMKDTPELDAERLDFLKCMVWRQGMNRREPLERLLALADAQAANRSPSPD